MAFSFGYKVVIPAAQVPSDQAQFVFGFSGNFPALKTVANGGHAINGNDIVWATDACGLNRLNWEIAPNGYDATTGDVEYWVDARYGPSGYDKGFALSSSVDNVFYLLFGDSSITTDQSAGGPITWYTGAYGGSPQSRVIYHFGSAASLDLTDSANGYNLGARGTPVASAGKFGGALDTNGGTGSADTLLGSGGFSFFNSGGSEYTGDGLNSFWFKCSTPPVSGSAAISFPNNFAPACYVTSNGYIQLVTQGGSANIIGSTNLCDGQWHHVCAHQGNVAGGGDPNMFAYVDGVLAVTTAQDYTGRANNYSAGSAFGSQQFDGEVDEVHLFAQPFSADYNMLEYRNGNQGTFFQISPIIADPCNYGPGIAGAIWIDR